MHIKLIPRLRPFLLFLLIFLGGISKARSQTDASSLNAYNRIEYRDLSWVAFHTPQFHIYFPKGSDCLAAFVSREVLAAKEILTRRMGTSLSILPAIIIYPSLTAQYESSIGMLEEVPLTFPTFVSKGSRIVLSYNGDYQQLKQQLYQSIARATWEKELGQTSIGSQIKGVISRELVPHWYKEGTLVYFSQGWTLQMEESLRRLFITDSPASFASVISISGSLSGAAFNYYLSKTVRDDAPLQIYYQLRKRKALPRALRLITKRPADSLYSACYAWYKERFSSGENEVSPINKSTDTNVSVSVKESQSPGSTKIPLPLKSSKRKGMIITSAVDPSGKNLAVVIAFRDHTRCLYVYDPTTRRWNKAITYHLPPWVSNHEADQYPLLCWSTSGSEVIATYPQKGQITIDRINSFGKPIRSIALPYIDGVSSVTPLGGDKYLLSAWIQGQSDLVIYSEKTGKYQTLTNDPADDSSPTLQLGGFKGINGRNGISEPVYFSSYRKGDTLFGQDTSHYWQGIYRLLDSHVMPIITDTSSHNTYSNPVLLDEQHLLVTTTKSGKEQLTILNITKATKRSTFSNNIASSQIISDEVRPYQYHPASKTISVFNREGDSIIVNTIPFGNWVTDHRALAENDTATGPWLRDYNLQESARKKEDSVLKAAKTAGGPSFLDGVLGGNLDENKKAQSKRDSAAQASLFKSGKAKPYILQLYSAYFSTQVNNDYFINRYQPYGTFQGTYKFPDVGGMVKGGLSDLFEHHHVSIAYRLPAGTEGSMFFTKYSNTAKRLDWSLAYYRNVESIKPDPSRAWVDENGRPYPSAAKVKTHYYEGSLMYPLSYYASVGSSLSVRKDRTVFLATDDYSLTFPALTDLWAGVSLWGKTSHLKPTLQGLYRGWKIKANCDLFKGFTGDESALAALSFSAQWHKPLYKYITLVVKVQAGYSGGDKKVLYNLGGIDNNLTTRVDTTVHFSQSAPYAFQTLITPFRGYLQNSLYGSRYGILNADVYFPIFETLIPIETAFESINHLQLGLFTDVASAAGDNRYTTNSKGCLSSYGFSARTILAGYPLRFDIAWPGSFSKDPIWFLSLNLQ